MYFRIKYRLTIFAIFLLIAPFELTAQAILEHPIIKPFSNSVLAENMPKYYKFNVFEVKILNKKTKKIEKVKVKGQYWKLLYEVRKPNGDRVKDISTVEFFENYKNAALERDEKF